MIRVLLADDHSILNESLKYLIENESDIKVVGCASNGSEAFELCGSVHPDVILMDVKMPVCDGIEGTRLIKSKYQGIKILILTTYDDRENLDNAIINGADGYVLKDIKPDELILAIKSISKGLSIMNGRILKHIAERLDTGRKYPEDDVYQLDFDLCEKDLEIIRLIAGGKSNREIAYIMHYSEGSIKNAVAALLSRLKLNDRTQLAVFAVRKNLV